MISPRRTLRTRKKLKTFHRREDQGIWFTKDREKLVSRSLLKIQELIDRNKPPLHQGEGWGEGGLSSKTEHKIFTIVPMLQRLVNSFYNVALERGNDIKNPITVKTIVNRCTQIKSKTKNND